MRVKAKGMDAHRTECNCCKPGVSALDHKANYSSWVAGIRSPSFAHLSWFITTSLTTVGCFASCQARNGVVHSTFYPSRLKAVAIKVIQDIRTNRREAH